MALFRPSFCQSLPIALVADKIFATGRSIRQLAVVAIRQHELLLGVGDAETVAEDAQVVEMPNDLHAALVVGHLDHGRVGFRPQILDAHHVAIETDEVKQTIAVHRVTQPVEHHHAVGRLTAVVAAQRAGALTGHHGHLRGTGIGVTVARVAVAAAVGLGKAGGTAVLGRVVGVAVTVSGVGLMINE